MQRIVTVQEKSNKDYYPPCPIAKGLLKKKVSLPGKKEVKFKGQHFNFQNLLPITHANVNIIFK